MVFVAEKSQILDIFTNHGNMEFAANMKCDSFKTRQTNKIETQYTNFV